MQEPKQQGATASPIAVHKPHPLDGAGRGAKLNAIITYVKDLERRLSTQQVEIVELKKKMDFEHQQTLQVFGFLGDIETRLEAFRALLTIPKRWLSKKPVFENEEYDSMWDRIKGIRVRGSTEFIQKGDFCKISYKAVENGVVLADEKDFPCRVGAGALFIEDEIVGKSVGLKDHEFVKTYGKTYDPNPNLAGKTVTFVVTVDKVKTRIEEINGEVARSGQSDHHDS